MKYAWWIKSNFGHKPQDVFTNIFLAVYYWRHNARAVYDKSLWVTKTLQCSQNKGFITSPQYADFKSGFCASFIALKSPLNSIECACVLNCNVIAKCHIFITTQEKEIAMNQAVFYKGQLSMRHPSIAPGKCRLFSSTWIYTDIYFFWIFFTRTRKRLDSEIVKDIKADAFFIAKVTDKNEGMIQVEAWFFDHTSIYNEISDRPGFVQDQLSPVSDDVMRVILRFIALCGEIYKNMSTNPYFEM